MITDEDGNTVKGYDYYAFGGIRNQSGSFSNTYKFTGKELDESELYYFGARYMDNAIGRFITPDPANGPTSYSNPQRLNPYVYCLNNPLNYIDPDGKRSYFINGVHYDPKTNDYGKVFVTRMSEAGIQNPVQLSPVFGKSYWGDLHDAIAELQGKDIYHGVKAAEIKENLANNPLIEGEQINIIGFSGGAYISLNAALDLVNQGQKADNVNQGQKVDNVVVFGTYFISKDSPIVKKLEDKGVSVIFLECDHDKFPSDEKEQRKVIKETKNENIY